MASPGMTGRQRYFAMLDRQPVDHVPRIPILMRYAAEHIGSNYGAFTADHQVLVEANQVCAATFGMDQVSAISDPYRETTGFGGEVHHDPDSGAHLRQPPLPAEDLTAEDIAGLPAPDPQATPRMRDRLEAIKRFRAESGESHSVLGWIEGPAAEAADVRGVENFMMDLLLEPELIAELMDVCKVVGLAFAKAQIDAGADTVAIGDAVASQVSGEVYEELILPRQQWLIGQIKACRPDVRVRLHICGNITHLLPGIATLAIDILDVDHMVDLAHAREVLGSRIALAGNIDPVAGVLRGSPDTIRQELRECYRKAGNPYLVNAGCEIPSGTPVENLLALCEPIPWQE